MMAPPPVGRERHKDKDSSVIAADGGQALRQEVGKRQQPNREQEGHKDDDDGAIAANWGLLRK